MNVSERKILEQIGYYRDDTNFVSLNLRPNQFNMLQRAIKQIDNQAGSLEEAVFSICCQWLANEIRHQGVMED